MNRECRTNDIMLIWWGFITYSLGLTWKTVLSLLSLWFIIKLQQDFCQQKLSVPIEGSISSAQDLLRNGVCVCSVRFFQPTNFSSSSEFFFSSRFFQPVTEWMLWHTQKNSSLFLSVQNRILFSDLAFQWSPNSSANYCCRRSDAIYATFIFFFCKDLLLFLSSHNRKIDIEYLIAF